jgi:hypothetical protein
MAKSTGSLLLCPFFRHRRESPPAQIGAVNPIGFPAFSPAQRTTAVEKTGASIWAGSLRENWLKQL